jgi:hypothetical protein
MWHVQRILRSFAALRRHVLQRNRTSTNGGSGSLRMTHQFHALFVLDRRY